TLGTCSVCTITMGKGAIVSLVALTIMLLLPMLLVVFDWRIELWTHPGVAPVVVLGMVGALYMFDQLMNGMVNPIFMLAVGAVTSAHYCVPQIARRQLPQTMRRPAYRP